MKTTVTQTQPTTTAFEVAADIAKNVFPNMDQKQIQTSIAPYVSNAIFHSVNQAVENERFDVIIALARTLDNDSLDKALTELKYSVSKSK